MIINIDLKQIIEQETGNKFNRDNKICCPFHSEKTASFSIKFNSNTNKWIYKCFGCGASGDAIDFIMKHKNINYNNAREYLGLSTEKSEEEKQIDKIKSLIEWELKQYRKGQELLGIFPYVDDNNKPIYYKAKFRKDDDNKEMAYYHIEGEKAKTKRGTDAELPYNLYNVLRTIKNKGIVIITEGEKDANTLNSILSKDYQATSIKNVKDLSFLDGARVYICGDTGEAGEKYINEVKRALIDNVSELKVINLPGIEDMGDNADVTDWLSIGRTIKELYEAFRRSIDIKLEKDIKSLSFTNKGLLDYFAKWTRDKIKYVDEMSSYIVWNGVNWDMSNKSILDKEIQKCLFDDLLIKVDKYLNNLREALKQDTENLELQGKIKDYTKVKNKLESLGPVKTIRDNYIGVCEWISSNKLDADINLLNCKNGVLNLDTGELLPHKADMLITKVTNVNYNPSAKCDNFISSLKWIFPDEATRREFQKAYGYSLGGGMGYEKVFIVWGKGENGKSTITQPMADVMGSYYNSLNARSLEPRKDNTTPSSDFAKLVGARFVLSSEPSQSQKLDDGMLKTMASGEQLNARFMRQNEFTYNPVFKLWIPTNALPYVTNVEHGFWRRLMIFPCKNKPEKAIPNFYRNYIKPNDLEGILNWALEGRRMLLEDGGFNPTKEMLEAVKEYKKDVNPIEEFISNCCTINPMDKILFKELFDEYNEWVEDEISHKYILGKRTFKNRLNDMGYSVKNSTHNQLYVMGLSYMKEEEMTPQARAKLKGWNV